MIEISINNYVQLLAFWLCFTRWTAAIFHFPIFDNISIPMVVKILSGLVITYAFFPYMEKSILTDIYYLGSNSFWILTVYYGLVGLGLGYFVKVIMNMFIICGTLIAQNIGLGAVRYFDPGMAQTVGPFEILIQWTVLMFILVSGALTPMFRGVYLSLEILSIHKISNFYISPQYIIDFFKSIFISGILLATPIIIIHILLIIIMAITSRAVPQMNVLLISFIVNIGIGLVLFTLLSDEFFKMSFEIYKEILGKWYVSIT